MVFFTRIPEERPADSCVSFDCVACELSAVLGSEGQALGEPVHINIPCHLKEGGIPKDRCVPGVWTPVFKLRS